MFNTYNIALRARSAEYRGDWEEAKRLWKICGSEKDVKAIEFLQEATRKGNEFRRLVSEMQNERKTDDEIFSEVNKIVYRNKN